MAKSFKSLFKAEVKSFGRQFSTTAKKQFTRSAPTRRRSGFFDMFMDSVTGAPKKRR